MAITPPPGVVEAILSDSTEVTRRVEIYEQDAYTIWHPDPELVSGDVSVSTTEGRDDRRGLSLVLNNDNGDLDNYPGGFWYDKIIRPYRGVAFWQDFTGRVAIEAFNPVGWYRFSPPDGSEVTDSGSALVHGTMHGAVAPVSAGALVGDPTGAFSFNGGYVSLDPTRTNLLDMRRKFTITFWFQTTETGEQAVYTAYDYDSTGNGIWIRLNGNDVEGRFSVYDGAIVHSAEKPNVTDGEWHHFAVTQGTLRTNMYLDSQLIGSTSSPAHPRNARFDVESWIGRHPELNIPFIGLLDEFAIFEAELTHADIISQYRAGRGVIDRHRRSWECPLGDFMVDDIGTQHHPAHVTVSGRDLIKRLVLSKFKVATAFEKGVAIEELVETIARNGGLDRFILPNTGRTTNKQFYFDRGVQRAEAIHEIALAYGYEIYINAEGYFVMQEPPDPALSPPIYTFKTGEGGTITSYEKKTRDTRIYNVIVVTGESTGEIPVYAIAENREPSSPTRIATPGVPGGLSERVYQYTSGFITTREQAQQTADNFLKVHALEEFEVNIGSIVIPWLEAGQVIEFVDPKPNPGDPTKFLMTEFSIPLSLDPMDLTGKRVTIVG